MIIETLVGSGLSWLMDLAKDKGETLVVEGVKKVTGIDLSKKEEPLSKEDIALIHTYRFDIENLNFKKLEARLKDKASARKHNIDIQASKDWLVRNTGSLIAIFTVLTAFVLDVVLINMVVDGVEVNPIYTLIQGAMNVRAVQVLSFYFGESKTNADTKRVINA